MHASARLDEIDPVWEALEADRRRFVWERDAAQRNASRAAARAERSLGLRLDATLAGLASSSALAAGTIDARVSTGSPSSAPPPNVDLPELGSRLALLRFHVEELERELDAIRGHADRDELRRLGTEAKNVVILARFAGVRSEVLAAEVPELGSARTIERIRRDAGRRPSTGLES